MVKRIFKRKKYYASSAPKYKTSFGDVVFNILNYSFFIIFTLACIFPFYYLFINTISDNDLVRKGAITLIPKGIHLMNYASLKNVNELTQAFRVTISRTIISTALTVGASGLVGFLVTKQEMWGRKFWYRFIIITMYFNAGLIPMFITMKTLGLTNSFWVYILPAVVQPFNITMFISQS